MPKAYHQVENSLPSIIKVMDESIVKTWSNVMGLGIIAAQPIVTNLVITICWAMTILIIFSNLLLTFSVTGNYYD